MPKGYKLRLPPEKKDWTTARLAQQISLQDQYIDQPRSRSYKVRKGDSLASVAKRHGTTAEALARLNKLSTGAELRGGRTLQLPDQPAARVASRDLPVQPGAPAVAVASPPAPAAATPAPAPQEQVKETLAEQRKEVAAIKRSEKRAEPVTAAEAEEARSVAGAGRRRRGARQRSPMTTASACRPDHPRRCRGDPGTFRRLAGHSGEPAAQPERHERELQASRWDAR